MEPEDQLERECCCTTQGGAKQAAATREARARARTWARSSSSKHAVFLWWLIISAAAVLIGEKGCSAATTSSEWDNGEVFTEDLLLRPLSDGKVLSHFYFKNTLRNIGPATHHHVFPKAISQLAQKFQIREMELSFTQGRWNYERWGAVDPVASSNAKPGGVELWASFNVPLDQVDPTWRNLTQALSGLFCASINFLESPAMVATPEFAFRPGFSPKGGVGKHQFQSSESSETAKGEKKDFGWLRYGALSREAACTENLTPWLKLVPCRDKAGVTTLLDRPSIYRGNYHSLRVHLRNAGAGAGALSSTPPSSDGTASLLLEQTLTLVVQPAVAAGAQPLKLRHSSTNVLPHWSLKSLFGRRLEGSCPVAKSSHVLLELEESLWERVQSLKKSFPEDSAQSQGKVTGRQRIYGERSDRDPDEQLRIESSVGDNNAFNLSPYPSTIFRGADDGSLLLDYPLEGYNKTRPLNLGILWKERISWPSVRVPFHVSRFLVGSGNQKGSIMIQLRSNHNLNLLDGHPLTRRYPSESLQASDVSRNAFEATIFHVVPWYVRLYTHTLTARVDGNEVPLSEVVPRMRIVPAEDRLSPAVLEMQLHLPLNISVFSLNIEFDKGFLHIDEHPPDANRGFDLPSALISFPAYQTQRTYRSSKDVLLSDRESPLLQTLQDAGPVHIYSESLLVSLATPDFSMPYNVITFTCTILALYFGSLLNTLRRRIGEEERRNSTGADSQGGKLKQLLSRYMEGKSEKQKKLTKAGGILVIAAIAVATNYFISTD